MSWSTYTAERLGCWVLGGYQQTPDRTHLNSGVQEVDPLGNLQVTPSGVIERVEIRVRLSHMRHQVSCQSSHITRVPE